MARRLWANTIAWRCRRRNSSVTRRVSARYERRIPSWLLTTGGLTKAKNFSARGAPLRSTSAIGVSVRRSARVTGLAMVADVQTNTGDDP